MKEKLNEETNEKLEDLIIGLLRKFSEGNMHDCSTSLQRMYAKDIIWSARRATNEHLKGAEGKS